MADVKTEKVNKKQKKNDFKINLIFDNKGEPLNAIIERAFNNYCVSRQN